MIKVLRYYHSDHTELIVNHKGHKLSIDLPYSEEDMTDELLARGLRVLKRKLGEIIANELKFEISTCGVSSKRN